MSDLYKNWWAGIERTNPTLKQTRILGGKFPTDDWLKKIPDGFSAPKIQFSAPNFSANLQKITLPNLDNSVFMIGQQVLNPGVRPPSNFFYKFLPNDPKNIFNFALQPSEKAINDVYRQILGWSKDAGGFPVTIDPDGNPVIDTKNVGEFSVKVAKILNDQLGLSIPPQALEILRTATKVDWAGVLEQIQGLAKGVSLESLNAIADGMNAVSGVSAGNAMTGVTSIATNAVQIYADGHISKEEGVNFAVNTGATIGSYVGSYFYPPIGTAIGAGVGALVGWITGISIDYGPPAATAEQFKASDLAKQYREIEKAFADLKTELKRQTWIAQCEKLQGAFYEELQKIINETAQIWTNAEAQTGWRFNLRWFDPNPGFNPELLSKFLGVTRTGCGYSEKWISYTPDTWAPQAGAVKPKRRIVFPGNCENHIICPYEYGCPYPNVPMNTGDSDRSSYDKFIVRAAYENSSRTAAAFAARGFPWLDPKKRPTCAELYDKTNDTDALFAMISWQVSMLPIVANIIAMDIHRTSIAVQVERDLWANAATYVVNGVNLGVLGRVALAEKQKRVDSAQLKAEMKTFLGVGAAATAAYWFLGRK